MGGDFGNNWLVGSGVQGAKEETARQVTLNSNNEANNRIQ